MTIITKPISDKKETKLEIPLVYNEHTAELDGKVDLEAASCPEPQYMILKAHARRVSPATTVCLFLTALLVMSVGIIGGVYIYRQFAHSHMNRFRGWCSVPYESTKTSLYQQQRGNLFQSGIYQTSEDRLAEEINKSLDRLKEEVEIDLQNENYEKIDVPDFRGGRRGRFIHDFNSNKTGIVDMDGKRCFVMPLNRQRVLPPKSMFDLISKMWDGYYEVDTEVVRETMRVVIPPISDLKSVGDFISRECTNLPTYMLEKYVPGVFKRSVDEGLKFAEFAGKNIVEFQILDLPEPVPVALAENSLEPLN